MIIFIEKTNNLGLSWYILEQKEQVKQYHSIIYFSPYFIYYYKNFYCEKYQKLKEFYDEHYLNSNINILVYLLYCISIPLLTLYPSINLPHFSMHFKVNCTRQYCCCCCSVTKSGPTLCNPMDCSTPGSPVLHCLPEFAQIHVRWVSDVIQPSHPLLPSSPHQFQFSSVQFSRSVVSDSLRPHES